MRPYGKISGDKSSRSKNVPPYYVYTNISPAQCVCGNVERDYTICSHTACEQMRKDKNTHHNYFSVSYLQYKGNKFINLGLRECRTFFLGDSK